MEYAERPCVLFIRLAAALFASALLLFGLQYTFLGGRRLVPCLDPVPSLQPEASEVVPAFVHYTWYSLHRHTFRFHHFISLLSARKFLKPKKIFFWCKSPPRGRWWDIAQKQVPELSLQIRLPPTKVFERPVRIPEHQSDIVRLLALLEFGGIYLDLDVLVLRSFEPLLRYNATMGYQLDNRDLCNGVIVARPGDRFLQLWYNEYRYFLDRLWDYHSVRLPDLLARRHPSLIHIEKTSFHRPNFLERDWIYKNNKIYPWRRNFAMHLWYRFYNVDHNPQDITTLKSTLGQMFRFIYLGKP